MATAIKEKKLTKEQIEKAMACETADELMKVMEAEGYSLTKDEAESFLAELSDVELGDETLEKAAGGAGSVSHILKTRSALNEEYERSQRRR